MPVARARSSSLADAPRIFLPKAEARSGVVCPTRVMQRIKAMFRARAIPTKGTAIYRPSERAQWLAQLEGGARVRAAALFKHLAVLIELRPPPKAAMLAEARRQPGWKVLRSIPYLGPCAWLEIMAIMRTPFRFRTKRNLWPYVGRTYEGVPAE